MSGKALICGGSISGLFTAAALQKNGWEIEVFERSSTELAGRGAGIVTHPEMLSALNAVGAETNRLGIEVQERVAYDLSGRRVHSFGFHQLVTSWNRVYQILRSLVPEGKYLTGREAIGYRERENSIELTLSGGRRVLGDILIGADGFRSAIRAQMLPKVRPEYSGYVVWRTLAAEADLPNSVRDDLFHTFGFFVPNGTQIIGYPIAGPGNDFRPGHLRYNFVWYSEVPDKDLLDMLTDTEGNRHAVTIPPPMVRPDVLSRMRSDAWSRLPTPFNDILEVSERPFFTPVYDHLSPEMATGRVALVGDAACVARPHVGMGVTKAAVDATTLAECLDGVRIPDGLHAYSKDRTSAARTAYETSRWLGRLIFDCDRNENLDGRSNPKIEAIMHETAVVPPLLRTQARNSS